MKSKKYLNLLWLLFFFLSPTVFASNPIITDIYSADPSAIVHNGRMYVYVGHDEGSTGFNLNEWYVYSSADLVNWTNHGTCLSVSDFSWALKSAWAGQMVQKNGKFYWYVPVRLNYRSGFGIGVAVGDSPTGPFYDARGSAIITHDMTVTLNSEGEEIWWDDIDPTVFIDNDGSAYLYWGNTQCYMIKLKDNMIEADSSITEVYGLPNFTEAPYLHKRGNLYYLSYAANYPETIDYATSYSITGPWTYQGMINDVVNTGGTNHQSILEFNGQWYFVYHRADLSGGNDYQRSVCIEKLYYNSDGTIQPIIQTNRGAGSDVTEQILYTGGPFYLNGTDSYIDLSDNLVSSCEDFTIAAWINLNSLDTWERIFDFGNSIDQYMFLTGSSNDGTLRYAITTSGNGGEQQINGSRAPSISSWQHVAVSYSGTTGKLYLNGELIGTNSNMTIRPSHLGNTVNNYIGKSQWDDPYLDGVVNDFRVYDYGLSADDIARLASYPPGN